MRCHPQKTGLEALPLFDLIKDEPVDYVLISHAHQDHLGSLPYLVKRHPYIKIIATPQTRALAELTLHNSVAILKQQLKEEDKLQVYTHEEIDLLIKSIEYKSYGENFLLNGYNNRNTDRLSAGFTMQGIYLALQEFILSTVAIKLFYTGDVNLDSQALLPGAKLPNIKVDTLILRNNLRRNRFFNIVKLE